MAGSQISTSVTIINSLLGFQAISLEGFSGSAATFITAGSKVEIASAFFTFASDETPQATTWTVITTANTAYITLTASGTAGSQIVTAKWTETAPVWSDSKQGFYASAASAVRVVAGCTKGGATSYQNKFIIDPAFGDQYKVYNRTSIFFDDTLAIKRFKSFDYPFMRGSLRYTWASTTDGTIYTQLEPLMNGLTDIDIQGHFVVSAVSYIVHAADKSGTTIRFFCTTGGSLVTVAAAEGGSVAYTEVVLTM